MAKLRLGQPGTARAQLDNLELGGLAKCDHWFTMPGERDRAHGANAAFADGQVSFKRWKYLGRKRIELFTHVANGRDRADLAWVVSALPSAREP